MSAGHEIREIKKIDRKATETLLALGCADASKLPDWAWQRVIAACLRVQTYEFKPLSTRRRGNSRQLPGEVELRDAVRRRLKIDRLPTGAGAKINVWATEINPVIEKRRNWSGRTDEALARKDAIWAGIVRRAEACLRQCGYERELVRGSGITKFGVHEMQTWNPAGVKLHVELQQHSGSALVSKDTGQVRIDAVVSARVKKSWYGRVYKEGIAVVDRAFVYDVCGRGEVRDGTLYRVKIARRGVGFQVNSDVVMIHKDKEGRVSFTAREPTPDELVGLWHAYDDKETA